MKWTKEKPQKEGWYWARQLDEYSEDLYQEELVYVMETGVYNEFGAHFLDGYYKLSELTGAEFSDTPIPEPEE